MEEMHRIHKEVPFGYWVMWVEPGFKALARKWRQWRARKPQERDRILAMR